MTENPIAEQLTQAQHEVEALRAQIDRLTRQFEVARARLEAFQVAAKAFEDIAPKPASKGTKARAPRKRVADESWTSLFQTLFLAAQEPYSYDDIMKAAISSGVAVKRDSLRTKMMNYANDALFDRVADGKFAFTAKGRKFFEIGAQAQKENEAASANATASDAGEFGVSPPSYPWNRPPVQSPSS